MDLAGRSNPDVAALSRAVEQELEGKSDGYERLCIRYAGTFIWMGMTGGEADPVGFAKERLRSTINDQRILANLYRAVERIGFFIPDRKTPREMYN